MSIALTAVSAGLLGYELLLMRLLGLAWWGHLAGFVIAVAMLGIGASGLLLYLRAASVRAHPFRWMAVGAGGLAVLGPAMIWLAGELSFTPFLLTWSVGEYGRLAVRILMLALPLFSAGVAVGVPFVARLAPAGRLYLFNMGGSGLGVFPVLLGLDLLHPWHVLVP